MMHRLTSKTWNRLIITLWFAIPLIASIPKIMIGARAYNNYLIYKYVFWHTWTQQPLYAFYPAEYLYQNHYGPTFSAIIAPFALMPDAVGIMCWALASIGLLYFAVKRLPVSHEAKLIVLAICLLEVAGTAQNQQYNTMLCASMILAFTYLHERKIWPAAFLIAGGFLTKLYGIVALAFVPFSGKYKQTTLWMIIALVVLIALPMLWSSPSFILQSYVDWAERLLMKNQENIHTNVTDGMQDLSFMGMVRRITGATDLSNLWFLAPAAICTGWPLLKFKFYSDKHFQLIYLAQVLVGLVIFSTSAESPTYIIAVAGIAIWYAQWEGERPRWLHAVLIFVYVLTILSYTDLCPKTIRELYVKRYALKALPCVVSWFLITWQLLTYKKQHVIVG